MWVLGNFENVDEVVDNLVLLEIWGNKLPVLNVVMGLHVPIHDAYGNNIVIEFMHGKMQIYDNVLGVLTNEPPLPVQMNNLAQYMYLSPNITQQTTINGETITNAPNSGLHGLPGGWSPMDRFVRMATLLRFVSETDNGLLTATNILNSVSVTDGMEIGYYPPLNKYVSGLTRWSTIKDLTNGVFYFRNGDGLIKAINLKKLNFASGTNHHTLPIHHDKPFIMDVTHLLTLTF